MNIALERLIAGIIATLRTDVIPNVSDSYGRGQAVGVIDLLNAITPRIEWAREPLQERVAARVAVLDAIADRLGEPGLKSSGFDIATASTAALSAEIDRLDGIVSDLVRALVDGGRGEPREAASAALALLKAHIHEDITNEMKRTRKPLFAEIAGGAEKKP